MFEWDEDKSEVTHRLRGFDFAYAALIFESDVLEFDDTRRLYGERRVCAIGQIDTNVLFVTYTWRGLVRRIISARLANRKERNVYHQAFG
ncbi:MAG: BrnT family toxin [Rhodospirillaceae bacterium]|nr:BrnT family toxin [Rhodospirillaceae bacterium]